MFVQSAPPGPKQKSSRLAEDVLALQFTPSVATILAASCEEVEGFVDEHCWEILCLGTVGFLLSLAMLWILLFGGPFGDDSSRATKAGSASWLRLGCASRFLTCHISVMPITSPHHHRLIFLGSTQAAGTADSVVSFPILPTGASQAAA